MTHEILAKHKSSQNLMAQDSSLLAIPSSTCLPGVVPVQVEHASQTHMDKQLVI
jgi:hypothetical protein